MSDDDTRTERHDAAHAATDRGAIPAPLAALVAALQSLPDPIDRSALLSTLAGSAVELGDVAPYVAESEHGYARRRVARTDAFELLVMTWRPGQGSAPHDHAGSLCAIRILRGRVREAFFAGWRDGHVEEASSGWLGPGEVLVDASERVHALRNDDDAAETLVTLHVYAPPLPELRRYALRSGAISERSAFARSPDPSTPTIAIAGGGFSGTLVAANVVRAASERGARVHVVLIDRQAAHGEGAAYRTADGAHLLNVPASNMSAWPDRPGDFLAWQRARAPGTQPHEFVPRRAYGEYVRGCLAEAAAAAPEGVSVEIRRAEVRAAVAREGGGFVLELDGGSMDGGPPDGGPLEARSLVLATGHRPPDDPLASRWTGSRARYVEDPWASLALGAIEPDEPVVLLGTGLTAVDVLLTVSRRPRTAPIVAVSRRGLDPHVHSQVPIAREDPTTWLEPILSRPGGPRIAELVRALRDAVARAEARGGDWRAVVDGLRPHTARIWRSLPGGEASRFLRHVRPFWEIHRHRVAPAIGAWLARERQEGRVRTIAARVSWAVADPDGVTLALRPRGEARTDTLRTAWVVNCTGPGSGDSLRRAPLLASLLDAGLLARDEHDLGVRTDDHGRALEGDRARDDLFVVGTLRKPRLWESTAVPELREQAASVARLALSQLADRG